MLTIVIQFTYQDEAKGKVSQEHKNNSRTSANTSVYRPLNANNKEKKGSRWRLTENYHQVTEQIILLV